MNIKQLEGLKVRIKPQLRFSDDIIGEVANPPMNIAGMIPIMIPGIEKPKYFLFPKCFESKMAFVDEGMVPVDIRKIILKYRQENSWQGILLKYQDGKSKINYTAELRNLDLDCSKAGKYGFIASKYGEAIKTAYDDFYSRTSVSTNDQVLRDALDDAVSLFNSKIVKETKQLLFDEAVKADNFINGTEPYMLPDSIRKYIDDNPAVIDEILEIKEEALSKIKKEFFDNEYMENQLAITVQKLKDVCEDITKKYTHKANADICYPILLKRLEKAANQYSSDHPDGFEGLIHVTNACNAIEIFNDGALKSRYILEKEEREFDDAALTGAMDVTDDWVKRCSRFYYAFNTPTYYTAEYNDPVGLVFDPIIMTWENAIFVFQSAATTGGVTPYTIKEAVNFSWNKVFHRGRYDTSDPSNWDITKMRNRDFLIKGNVPVKYIKKIYFPNERVSKNVNEILLGKLDGIEQEINIQKFGYKYFL